jgi:hypothetical protein
MIDTYFRLHIPVSARLCKAASHTPDFTRGNLLPYKGKKAAVSVPKTPILSVATTPGHSIRVEIPCPAAKAKRRVYYDKPVSEREISQKT